MATAFIRIWVTSLIAILALALAPQSATAQSRDANGAPLDLFTLGKGDLALPELRQSLTAPLPLVPQVNIHPSLADTGAQTNVYLEARLGEETPPMTYGIEWRIFDASPDDNGDHPLLVSAVGGRANVPLPAGDYLVHAAFGRASVTKRIRIGTQAHSEFLNLNAGGLRLSSVVGDDRAPDTEKVSFEISSETDDGEKEVVARGVRTGRVVGLNAGVYHVVSRYGDVNAIVRADIEVPAGKLTDVLMRHTGAEVTLKLVEYSGGEALANTNWSVLTSGGDTVHESVGAFPRIILAEGSYTAVAQHKSTIYTRDFKTSPGINHDVEVRLTDKINNQPETTGR